MFTTLVNCLPNLKKIICFGCYPENTNYKNGIDNAFISSTNSLSLEKNKSNLFRELEYLFSDKRFFIDIPKIQKEIVDKQKNSLSSNSNNIITAASVS